MTNYNFSVQRGDTAEALQFRFLVNGVPLNLTSASVLCQFRKTVNAVPALALTQLAGITINAPTDGQLRINSQIFSIPTGAYLYDIEITLADTSVKTYVGGTLNVLETISRAS